MHLVGFIVKEKLAV